jgi:O-antigen/teichoic acid export membrane protein
VSLRSLLRASTLYTAGNIAPKIGAFLLLPIYVRFLTQEEYGALALLTSLAGILAIVYHLGLDSAVMRLHFDVQGRSQVRLYTTATLFSLSIGAGLTLLLALALGPFFDVLFSGIEFVPLGALALTVALLGSLTYVPSTLFRASGQPVRFLAVNLGSFLLSSLVSVVLVTVFGFGAAGVLTGQVIASAAVLVVTVIVIGRLGPWAFDRSQLADALRLGLPMVPHAIAGWALRLADRWLIALLIGLPAVDARAAVGVYAVGYQLGFVVSIVITSFNAAWSPYFYRIGQRRSGPAFYREMTTIVIGALLALAAAVSVLAPEVVAVVARPGYEEAADILPIVAFASVLQGMYIMFVTVVFLMKRTGRLAGITVTSALLNVFLNFVLIPRFGIAGAAWATFGAYLFFAGSTYLFARRMYPLRVDWPRLVVMGASAGAAVVVGRIVAPGPSVGAGLVHLLIAVAVLLIVAGACWTPSQRLRAISRALPAEA